MRLSPTVALALSLFIAACGGGDDKDPADPLEPVSKDIDAVQGGSVTLADGSFTVDIPPGALASDATITIRQVKDDEIPAWLPKRLGPVVELLPDGLTFTAPVTLQWKLGESVAIADGRLAFAVAGAIDDANQRVLPSSTKITHSAEATVVTESVTHFSLHAAFASESNLVSFGGLGLDVTFPTNTPKVGESWLPDMNLVATSAQSLVFTFDGYSAIPELVVRAFTDSSGSDSLRVSAPTSIALVGGVPYPVAGPIFTCTSPFTSGTYRVGAAFTADALTFEAEEEAVTACSERAGDEGKDEQINVSETQRLVQVDGVLATSGAPGVGFNILHADSATANQMTNVGGGVVYDFAIASANEDGPASFSFTTPAQTFSANRVGAYYAPDGLVAADLFGAGGNLSVTADSAVFNRAWTETVPTPPAIPTNAIDVLAGMNSKLAIPADLVFDGVYVSGIGAGAGGGNAGFGVLIPRSAMTADNGILRSRLIPQAIVDEVAASGIVLTDISVGLANHTTTNAFFAGTASTEIRAVSAIVVNASELGETVVDPGNYTVEQCNELPGTFASVDAGSTAVLCITGTSCFVSNDTSEDTPLASTACSGTDGHRALEITNSAGTTSIRGDSWPMVWSSTGIVYGFQMMIDPPESTPLRVIMRNPVGGGFYDVNLSYVGSTATIESAAPFAGPLPDYGVQYHCPALPKTFGTPASGTLHAQVCASNFGPSGVLGECFALGVISETPEAESCPSGVVPVNFSYSGEYPYVQPGYNWKITGISSGSYLAELATGFAENTLVTVTVEDKAVAGAVTSVVFTWNTPANTFTIVSVDEP